MTPCGWSFNVQMQAIVWVFWAVGVGLVSLTCAGVLAHPFAPGGVCCVAFGCTGQVGLWMRRFAAENRAAFDLGRESVLQMRR